MVSLCEKCQNNDWRHFQDIIDAIKEAGGDRPGCIWCAATDRPEDLKFDHCRNFDGYPQKKRSAKVQGFASEPRYINNPRHKAGHRKIKSLGAF